MSLSWGAVAGAFMAPFFYGLYWKRATHHGVVAGMVSGLVISILLFYQVGNQCAQVAGIYKALGGMTPPIAASIGMIVPFIVVPVVSMFTAPPKKELLDKAFSNI
jgi:SSS family solute:Na+ symporter